MINRQTFRRRPRRGRHRRDRSTWGGFQRLRGASWPPTRPLRGSGRNWGPRSGRRSFCSAGRTSCTTGLQLWTTRGASRATGPIRTKCTDDDLSCSCLRATRAAARAAAARSPRSWGSGSGSGGIWELWRTLGPTTARWRPRTAVHTACRCVRRALDDDSKRSYFGGDWEMSRRTRARGALWGGVCGASSGAEGATGPEALCLDTGLREIEAWPRRQSMALAPSSGRARQEAETPAERVWWRWSSAATCSETRNARESGLQLAVRCGDRG